MHICVLGAGVIGVTSAYRLLQLGHRVTLVDASPEAGSQTSLGNGAQLSYSYVAPLADPSIWTQWPYYLLSPSSPLTMRPQADPAQWRWLVKFLGACNSGQVRESTVNLLHLASLSRTALAQLTADVDGRAGAGTGLGVASPLDFSFRHAGKLVMYSDAKALEGARRQVAFQAGYGCEQEVVSLARCFEIEPALAKSQRNWVGGVYTASEDVGDCGAFCRQLVAAMRTFPDFSFLPNTRVNAVHLADGALRAVGVSGGGGVSSGNNGTGSAQQIEADRFVLALGAESAGFASLAGFTLPLYPLKGYSITVPLAAGSTAAPQVSITDLAHKIVYARLGDSLRVAGRVELVGMNPAIPASAIRQLTAGVGALFPGCADLSPGASLAPWAGFRPATPTGVPVVGSSPVRNLFLNIGHGALGWTLACGSASLLADRIMGQPPAIDDTPFQLQHA